MDSQGSTGHPILSAAHLSKTFSLRSAFWQPPKNIRAVQDVSFDIQYGKSLGLVGESGCGKTTLIRTLLCLTPPSGGSVLFEDQSLFQITAKELKKIRRDMQMVFQDPYASLHPMMNIETILMEPLRINRIGTREERRIRIADTLHAVGLSPEHLRRYPHEFSGGQRQRIVIARALVLQPKLLILDEPVSALDVSVRSQILNLLEELQQTMGLSYLLISHDLSVVEHLCDQVMVMYLGKIMEYGSCDQIFYHPLSPYTKALLSAIPTVSPSGANRRILLRGEIPSPIHPPAGCVFKTRCPLRDAVCDSEPVPAELEPGHTVTCHKAADPSSELLAWDGLSV